MREKKRAHLIGDEKGIRSALDEHIMWHIRGDERAVDDGTGAAVHRDTETPVADDLTGRHN